MDHLDKSNGTNGSDSSGAQTESSRNGTPQGKNLIQIMGRKLVIGLALGAVIGAAALCLVSIFWPTLFPSQLARFFMCLLIAFLFSVFVFTLYPTDYKISLGKIISIPFVLVGPAALWIGLFLLFWNLLPAEGISGKTFKPDTGSPALYSTTTWVSNWKPQPPTEYYILQGARINGSIIPNSGSIIPIEGFYIEFDAANSRYTAELVTGPNSQEIKKHYEAEFDRGASTYHLTLLK